MNVEAKKDATANSAWTDRTGDRGLREARKRLLSRFVPGASTRRLKWSKGSTEIIEVGEGPPLVLVHGGLSRRLVAHPASSGASVPSVRSRPAWTRPFRAVRLPRRRPVGTQRDVPRRRPGRLRSAKRPARGMFDGWVLRDRVLSAPPRSREPAHPPGHARRAPAGRPARHPSGPEADAPAVEPPPWSAHPLCDGKARGP